MKIRSMKMADVSAVAHIQVHSWRKAYEGIIDEAYLSSLDVEKKIINWKKGIEINSDVLRLVICDGQQVLGFAIGLENREGIEGADAELAAIYLDPDYWNKKLGEKLFLRIEEEFRHRRYRSFFVWVLEENTRARKFYEKRGGKLLPQRKSITLDRLNYSEVAYLFSL